MRPTPFWNNGSYIYDDSGLLVTVVRVTGGTPAEDAAEAAREQADEADAVGIVEGIGRQRDAAAQRGAYQCRAAGSRAADPGSPSAAAAEPVGRHDRAEIQVVKELIGDELLVR